MREMHLAAMEAERAAGSKMKMVDWTRRMVMGGERLVFSTNEARRDRSIPTNRITIITIHIRTSMSFPREHLSQLLIYTATTAINPDRTRKGPPALPLGLRNLARSDPILAQRQLDIIIITITTTMLPPRLNQSRNLSRLLSASHFSKVWPSNLVITLARNCTNRRLHCRRH
jgi:hypothetical protein